VLGAIAFVENLVKSVAVKVPLRLLHAHGIGDETLASFGASSKMNNEWGFLEHLHQLGWRAADQWLAEYLAHVGKRSTVDLSGLIPPDGGLLTSPSFLNKTPLSTSNATAQECMI
jgi:NTE family protein